MYNGTLTKSTEIIDRYDMDVWIREEDNDFVLDGGFVDDSLYEALKANVSGIDEIERLIYQYYEAEDKDNTM
jgi:hypothetical protein